MAAPHGEQATDCSKTATMPRKIDILMKQNISLIWLDSTIDDKSADYNNIVNQLRNVMNTINTFTDADQCIQFIEDMGDRKACVITSDSLGQHVVPHVHDMSQVDSVFIFCSNRIRHEQWTKVWPKIKGVFSESAPIGEALKQLAKQCERNAISMSFVATSVDASKRNLDQLPSTFMYTQILKEILLTIKFDDKHIKEFTDYCRDTLAKNQTEFEDVDNFEQNYRHETPIWWYTSKYFLCPMLNLALRVMNTDIIVRMGFFTSDLHRQIEQLHLQQYGDEDSKTTFVVFRGQGISKTDFEQMTQTKGGLLSFNNFLSTSKKRDVSYSFAESNADNPDLVGILFVMTINPEKSVTPFASVNDVGYYKDAEDEVLFSMQTVFRIDGIKPIGRNQRLFQVDLILTNDNDRDLRVLTNRIREETYPNSTGWYRLGLVLLKMGQFEQAQQVYKILLGQATDESEKAPIYYQIGSANENLGNYTEAITYHEKSLEIRRQLFSPNHPDLGISHNNIGNVYYYMGDYSKALSSFQKALEIRQESLSSKHPDLGTSYNNIGNVYSRMGDYPKALSSFEKALAIRQQSLPQNHPDLGASYSNIAHVYFNMSDYGKALLSYENTLEIAKRSLPPNHPDFGMSYNNIGNAYYSMGDYPKALSYFKKAVEIRQQSLSSKHPDLGTSYNNIGVVYQNMGDYSNALSCYEKALEIRQPSLPPNHPDFGMSYNNIGLMYKNMGDYPKALSALERAFEIHKKSVPSNHADMGGDYNNIGNVYKNMGDYPKALSSYENGLAIQKQSLPSNHPALASTYSNIGVVYQNMGDYPNALLYYKKALGIRQQKLPSEHPDLALSYGHMGSYIQAWVKIRQH